IRLVFSYQLKNLSIKKGQNAVEISRFTLSLFIQKILNTYFILTAHRNADKNSFAALPFLGAQALFRAVLAVRFLVLAPYPIQARGESFQSPSDFAPNQNYYRPVAHENLARALLGADSAHLPNPSPKYPLPKLHDHHLAWSQLTQ